MEELPLFPESENDNPIWDVRPRRTALDPDRIANATEENARIPGGFAVIRPEEWIAAGAPDAVHTAGDAGDRYALDTQVIIAYLISAVQHCHEGLARRVAREAELALENDQLQTQIDQLRAAMDTLIRDLVKEKGRIDKLPKYASGLGEILGDLL